MKRRYLFLDDETGGPTTAMLNGFNDTGQIELETLKLEKNEIFETVCAKIIDCSKQQPFDGLMLDLCLDGAGENSMGFKAPALAQQIRTKTLEGVLPQCPIVLCSTMANLDSFYKRDRASHGLFDYYFVKTGGHFEKDAIKLQALASGYDKMNKEGKKIEVVLGREVDSIDERIIAYLGEESLSSFDVAQFVIKELLERPGILIDEETLAARMGVDREASGMAWKELNEILEKEAVYSGLFANGWKRYWAELVSAFFMNLTGGNPYQIMRASERVETLQRIGIKGLVVAQPIKYNKSSYFDTICQFYKKPMDSMEGIPKEDTVMIKPWQEHRYVSFLALASGNYQEKDVCVEGIKKYEDIKDRLKHG